MFFLPHRCAGGRVQSPVAQSRATRGYARTRCQLPDNRGCDLAPFPCPDHQCVRNRLQPCTPQAPPLKSVGGTTLKVGDKVERSQVARFHHYGPVTHARLEKPNSSNASSATLSASVKCEAADVKNQVRAFVVTVASLVIIGVRALSSLTSKRLKVARRLCRQKAVLAGFDLCITETATKADEEKDAEPFDMLPCHCGR